MAKHIHASARVCLATRSHASIPAQGCESCDFWVSRVLRPERNASFQCQCGVLGSATQSPAFPMSARRQCCDKPWREPRQRRDSPATLWCSAISASAGAVSFRDPSEPSATVAQHTSCDPRPPTIRLARRFGRDTVPFADNNSAGGPHACDQKLGCSCDSTETSTTERSTRQSVQCAWRRGPMRNTRVPGTSSLPAFVAAMGSPAIQGRLLSYGRTGAVQATATEQDRTSVRDAHP